MPVDSFFRHASLEELIKHLIENSFLSNKDVCTYFLVDNWDKIPKGAAYPIVTAQTNRYEYDGVNTYADIRIVILYKHPANIVCPENNDMCIDKVIADFFQLYARAVFEISDYLLGNLKLKDGSIISDFSLAGTVGIRKWKNYDEYNRVVLRGRGAEDLLPTDVALVEATIPLKGPKDRLCCTLLNPEAYEY